MYFPPGPAAPQPEAPKQKGWIRRHKVRSAVIAVCTTFGVFTIIGVAATGSGTSGTPNPQPAAASSPAAWCHANGDGCNEPTTPAPAPAPTANSALGMTVGSQLIVSDETGDLGTITVQNVRATSTPADQYGEGPKHGEFLIVSVRADSTSSSMSVYEGDFYVVVNGTHYEEDNGNAMFATNHDTLGYQDSLGSGEHVSGPVVFDIPAGMHGKVVYNPNFDGPAVGSWKF